MHMHNTSPTPNKRTHLAPAQPWTLLRQHHTAAPACWNPLCLRCCTAASAAVKRYSENRNTATSPTC